MLMKLTPYYSLGKSQPTFEHLCCKSIFEILILLHSVPRIVALITVFAKSIHACEYVRACMLTWVFTWLKPYLKVLALIFFLNFYMWRIEFTDETYKKWLYLYVWLWRPRSLTHTVQICSLWPWLRYSSKRLKQSSTEKKNIFLVCPIWLPVFSNFFFFNYWMNQDWVYFNQPGMALTPFPSSVGFEPTTFWSWI